MDREQMCLLQAWLPEKGQLPVLSFRCSVTAHTGDKRACQKELDRVFESVKDLDLNFVTNLVCETFLEDKRRKMILWIFH